MNAMVFASNRNCTELNRYVNVCETMMNWNKFYQLMHTLTIFILVPMVTQKVLQVKMEMLI
ncbi:hypothetical protein CIK94_05340 [Prevotella sp. P4-51]|nr:hypothetical protein CIK94_05340 [Prevotella sp. P4-51]